MSKNNFRHSKKIIGYFLSLLMVFSLLPVNPVFAQDVEYTYSPVGVSNAQADSVEASGKENGGLAQHAIDGSLDTVWHTKWDNATESDKQMPHWISYDIVEPTTIDVSNTGANLGKMVLVMVSLRASISMFRKIKTPIQTLVMAGRL